jgi:hypothetical protein
MSRASLRHRFRHQSPNLKIARKQRRTGAGEIECREITPTSRDSFDGPAKLMSEWTKLCRSYLSRPRSTLRLQPASLPIVERHSQKIICSQLQTGFSRVAGGLKIAGST